VREAPSKDRHTNEVTDFYILLARGGATLEYTLLIYITNHIMLGPFLIREWPTFFAYYFYFSGTYVHVEQKVFFKDKTLNIFGLRELI
jgi:hypothetical protein